MDIVAVKDSELERYVTKIMLEIGVPAHLKGYHYLRDAIILSGKDMEVEMWRHSKRFLAIL